MLEPTCSSLGELMVHLFPILSSKGIAVQKLGKSAIMSIITPQKSAKATNQGFPSLLEPVVKSFPARYWKQLLFLRCHLMGIYCVPGAVLNASSCNLTVLSCPQIHHRTWQALSLLLPYTSSPKLSSVLLSSFPFSPHPIFLASLTPGSALLTKILTGCLKN